MSKSAQKKTSTTNRSVGLLAAGVNVICWGIAPILIKAGVSELPPAVFLYYRFLIATLILTPVFLFFRSSFNSIRSRKDLMELLFIGLLSNPLNLIILFEGVKYTTSAAASLIASVNPIVILLGSSLFLHEKIRKQEILGAVIATLGTLLIVLETPKQAVAPNPILGNTLVFLYNIVWGMAVLYMKKLSLKHHPILFSYSGWVMGLLVCGLLSAFFYPKFFFMPLMLLGMETALVSVLFMSIFGSVVAFTAYQIAQKHLDASEVGLFAYLQPVISVPISVFILQEKIGFFGMIGVIFLLLGVVFAEFHPRSRLASVKKTTIVKRK